MQNLFYLILKIYQNNPKDIGQESEMLVGDTIDASEVVKDENSPEQSVDQVLFHDDLQEMLNVSSKMPFFHSIPGHMLILSITFEDFGGR